MLNQVAKFFRRAALGTAIVGSVAALTAPAAAKPAEQAPAPKKWLREVESALQSPVGFPHRLLFLKTLPTAKEKVAPTFLDLDVTAFNALGFFQAVDVRSAAWDYKLNPQMAEKSPLVVLPHVLSFDTVIVASEDGPWQILRIAKGRRRLIAKVAGPSDLEPQTIYDWLPSAFGWDGVVLAQKNEYLLVASTAKVLAAPEIQALAVKDSQKKIILPKTRKGTGLLSLNRIDGGLGIFDIVFLAQGVKTLPVGTKLIVEKKAAAGSDE